MYGLAKIASEYDDELKRLRDEQFLLQSAQGIEKHKINHERGTEGAKWGTPGLAIGALGGAGLGLLSESKFPKGPGMVTGGALGMIGGALGGNKIGFNRFDKDEKNQERYKKLDMVKRVYDNNEQRINELNAMQNQ